MDKLTLIAKCGVTYRLADKVCPPKQWRYRLFFWDSVAYFTRRTEAETMRAGLPYYQQEDSFIVSR
jgi:hypothetical protein